MTQGLQLSRQNATEPVLGIYTVKGKRVSSLRAAKSRRRTRSAKGPRRIITRRQHAFK